ncbi:sigma factor G inhibitor Gin [Bacillus lacus]|uniref:Sigma factor G inhibitor Gin n=1 Tax=Metabacillus lacus TaxID=1983721 RepID=A0A7X2J005_9BACI|nr:sigma factor G inhibitor Gin [Metabacillus lacus]MRX72930.1 sigma factor G inhibitor Gin [Metabacillus lacus]
MEVEQAVENENKSSAGEVCVVCDARKEDGIHLYTSFVCTECEQEMVQTQTFDPKYQFFIKKLKRVNTPPLYS